MMTNQPVQPSGHGIFDTMASRMTRLQLSEASVAMVQALLEQRLQPLGAAHGFSVRAEFFSLSSPQSTTGPGKHAETQAPVQGIRMRVQAQVQEGSEVPMYALTGDVTDLTDGNTRGLPRGTRILAVTPENGLVSMPNTEAGVGGWLDVLAGMEASAAEMGATFVVLDGDQPWLIEGHNTAPSGFTQSSTTSDVPFWIKTIGS